MDNMNQMQQQSMDVDDMNTGNRNAAQSSIHLRATYDSMPSTSRGLMGNSMQNNTAYGLTDGNTVSHRRQQVNITVTNIG